MLPVGERLGHCAGGGRRNHILSISSYFCISVSFFLKAPAYMVVQYIPFNVLGFVFVFFLLHNHTSYFSCVNIAE